jgi:hypothetical protein
MLLLEPARGTSITLPLADGDQGTAQTIALIRQLVDRGMKDPAVNRTALSILQNVPPHDEEAEVRAIYDWVRGHIRFTKDLYGKETLRPAAAILEVGAGDCDDINGILLPALLGTVGYRARLVTVASQAEAPDQFSHVYAEVCVGGQWIPLDAARPYAAFGKAPMNFMRKRIWDLQSSVYQDVKGLGQLPSAGLGVDWGDVATNIAKVIGPATSGAAKIIQSARMPVYRAGYSNYPDGETPASATLTASVPGYVNLPGFGYVSTQTAVIFGALAIGLLFMLRK